MKSKKIFVGSLIAGVAIMMTVLTISTNASAQEVNCYVSFTEKADWPVGVTPDHNENGKVCMKNLETVPPREIIIDDIV